MTNDYGNLELHKVLLAAMKDIDKICREHGLRYFLHAGTLLGAMNHKGFIPWDDDVDISMFPNDFLKFQDIIANEYAEQYFLETYDNTENHYSKLNKLRILGTSLQYIDGTTSSAFVDISIFHSVPNNILARFSQRMLLELFDRVLAAKSGAIVPTSLPSKVLLRPLASLSKKRLGQILDWIMTWYDSKSTQYYALMIHMLPNPYTGMNGYENDFVPEKICQNPRHVPFEDSSFMVYSDPEFDLIRRYGEDYWKPYPEEKRKTKHGIVSFEHTNL